MNEQLNNLTNDVIQLRIAAQLAPRRWQRQLDQLQVDLESGLDWPKAVDQLQQRQPELGNLLAAALAAGHPASIIMNLMQRRATSRISWQRLLSALVYPLVLLIAALLVCSLLSMAMLDIGTRDWKDAHANLTMFSKQSNVLERVRDFYDASVGALLVLAWGAALVGSAWLVASPGAWLKLVSGLPVLGRTYRWLALSELLNRISVFSQYQPVLGKTLELAEQSYGKQALGPICNYLGQAVARGEALPNALHQTIVSDARAGMALTLIDAQDLSGSTQRASRLLDEMILATCNQLRLILPLFIMLVIASLIWSAWSSYFELMSEFRQTFYW